MELKWTSLMCILWGCLVLLSFFCGGDCNSKTTKVFQDGDAQPRGRHRLQLLFPLLLRISTRLATLMSTALMSLFGIVLFVIFSKKALIVSLFALFLSLSGKINAKIEDIYIHKVNSYPDYNDEEHIHYYHHGPLKYKTNYESHSATKTWKKNFKRTVSSPSQIPRTPLPNDVKPFKALSRYQNRVDSVKRAKRPVTLSFVPKPSNSDFISPKARSKGKEKWMETKPDN